MKIKTNIIKKSTHATTVLKNRVRSAKPTTKEIIDISRKFCDVCELKRIEVIFVIFFTHSNKYFGSKAKVRNVF